MVRINCLLLLMITFLLAIESCSQKGIKEYNDQTFFIVNSQAGIPFNSAFPRGGMNELKPHKATLSLIEQDKGDYDLSIDYSFKMSGMMTTTDFSIKIPGVHPEANPKGSIHQKGLLGECIMNSEKSSFEEVSLQGSIRDNLIIEGLCREAPFRLEVISVQGSSNHITQNILNNPMIDYLSCWEEWISNESNKNCIVQLITEGGTVKLTLVPGERCKSYYYGDGGGIFWGGYCTELDVTLEGSETITVKNDQLFQVVHNQSGHFHLSATEKDWYLCSTEWGSIEKHSYVREELVISNGIEKD